MIRLLFTIPVFNNLNDIITYVGLGVVGAIVYFVGKKQGKKNIK